MNDILHVLLIDDNPDDRLLVIRELRREFPGIQVKQIVDAQDWTQALEAGDSDLVITDYQLRWTDGLAVLHAVKSRRPDHPVIMFTGTGSEEIAVEAMKAGLDDYILKSPQHFARLPAAVRLILERARGQAALKEAEARYQTLFDRMPVGLYRSTPDGQLLDANPALVQMLGYPDREALLAVKAADLYANPGDRTRWRALMERQGTVRDFEERFRRYDGTTIWARDSARAVSDAEGQVLYYEGSMEDITERRRVEEEIHHRNRELAALNAVAGMVSRSLNLEEILNDVTDKVLELMGVEAGGIYLADAEASELVLKAHRGVSEEFVQEVGKLKVAEGEIERNPQWKGLTSVPSHGFNETILTTIARAAEKENLGSHLIVPMASKDVLRGVLVVASHDVHEFTAQEVDLLTAIGNQIGVAVENAQLFEQSRQHADDLSLLYEVGQLFSSSLKQETVFAEISRRCVEVLDVDLALVRLVEDSRLVVKGSYYRYPEEKEEVERLLQEHPIHVGKGIAGRVAQTGEPVIYDGAPVESLTLPGYVDFLRRRSWLLVPIKVQDRNIGVLTLITADPARSFSQRDISLAQEIANQAAVAIENARLYQETKRRVEEMASVYNIGVATTSTLSLDAVLKLICEQVSHLMNVASFYIALYDTEKEELRFEMVIDDGVLQERFARKLADGAGLSGWVVQTRKPLLIRDVEKEELPVKGIVKGTPTRSWLGVPLWSRDQVVGVMGVQSYQPNAFDEHDQQLLSTIATQAAIAIENARLYETEQRQAREAAAVSAIAQALNASIDLTGVFEAIAHELRRVVSYDRLSLVLLSDDRQHFTVFAATGQEGTPLGSGVTMPVEDTSAAADVLAGRPHLTPDLSTELDLPAERALYDSGLRSRLDLPLMLGQTVIGALRLASFGSNAFSVERLPVLVQVADAVAAAVQSTQLYDETRRRAAHLEALNAVIAAAAAAPDLRDLLQIALDHALRALELEMGAIWVAGQHAIRGFPPEIGLAGDQMARATCAGIPDHVAIEDWQRLAAGDPLSALAPLMAPFGIRASLTVPILVESQRIGGLSLADSVPRSWSGEEVALVEAVGHQLGEAVERLRLLEKTREQAQQVRQIISTVPEGVLLLDAGRRVVLANPAAGEYLDALTDSQWGDTLRPGSGQALRPSSGQALRPGSGQALRPSSGQALTHLGDRPLAELLTSPPKGLWHEVATDGWSFEVIARPIETGPTTGGWVLVIRDVTQEREIQRRIQQQERLAAVGQLAAGIAHDFNNIMAVIVLYSQMALRTPDLLPKTRERLTIVSQQAQRATDLIQQILDFSRRAVLERRPLDLVPFMKEQVKLLARTLPESIRIDLICGAGEHSVNADPTRMQQVIMNLAVNARDAMPQGGELRIGLERIRIESRKEAPLPEMSPGEWVRVTVTDTGAGIAPDVLPHIFEPFFTTKAPLGSGLGLAQVYGIVKQHEGHIDMNTKIGEGTTFILYLPALPAHPPEVPTLETPALPQGQGETMLVVEDDAATREALRECLELLNYRVLKAANGREALATFERHRDEIALVLSDVVMPEMGGIALLHALKQKGQAVPVVMLTGHPMEEQLEDLRAQGLSDWLPKPPSLEQLAQVIARILDRGL